MKYVKNKNKNKQFEGEPDEINMCYRYLESFVFKILKVKTAVLISSKVNVNCN